MMGFGGIAGILLIAIIIWAVIQFTNKNNENIFRLNTGKPDSGEENALEILKKRYARGEIGQEEYERMKKEIS